MLVQCLKQDRFPGRQAMAQQALGTTAKWGARGCGAADATRVPQLGTTHLEPQQSHRLRALSITLLQLQRRTSLPATFSIAGH